MYRSLEPLWTLGPKYPTLQGNFQSMENVTHRPSGIWGRARDLAQRTPESRNRYVDLLRALSICAVVVGHWLMAAPHAAQGQLSTGHMLGIQPWTHGLTWVFQVMPIFFLVGGYSNGASWSAARRSGTGYSEWLTARLRRLVGPVLPLLVAWSAIAVAAHAFRVPAAQVSLVSQMALVPIWFLAVYVGVAVLAPLTHAAWRRFGFGSYVALVGAAVAVDLAAFVGGLDALRWTNYAFVWIAVHQLGYAWRDGRLAGPRRALPWAAGGLLALVGLVGFTAYPLAMVGVPGEELSNTLPPTVALLALAVFQSGLVLAIEPPARRWLARSRAWTLTVLTNGMIMSVYLWHLTAMIVLVGLAYWGLGGFGLALEPGSGAWWATRPLWLACLGLTLVPFVLGFARFERPSGDSPRAPIAAWRLVAGAAMVCVGLAVLAYGGIGHERYFGLRIWAVLLPLCGAALVQFGPLARVAARAGALGRPD